jgi:hypothetical protein
MLLTNIGAAAWYKDLATKRRGKYFYILVKHLQAKNLYKTITFALLLKYMPRWSRG